MKPWKVPGKVESIELCVTGVCPKSGEDYDIMDTLELISEISYLVKQGYKIVDWTDEGPSFDDKAMPTGEEFNVVLQKE